MDEKNTAPRCDFQLVVLDGNVCNFAKQALKTENDQVCTFSNARCEACKAAGPPTAEKPVEEQFSTLNHHVAASVVVAAVRLKAVEGSDKALCAARIAQMKPRLRVVPQSEVVYGPDWKTAVLRKAPCEHFGRKIRLGKDGNGNPRLCPTCEVHVCDIHGECTKGANAEGIRSCTAPLCPDYSPEDAIPDGPDPGKGKKKLILKVSLSPGDIITLTTAVKELHTQYPGQFLTDVRTPASEIWENNPYITKIADDDPSATRLDLHYDLIHQSNQRPNHFIEGYCEDLAKKLGLPSLRPREFKGHIYLSEAEKAPFPGLPTTGYWLLNAGSKKDFTIKQWPKEYFQAVVDQLLGRVTFVQIGARNHRHPTLENVIDLRGKTTHRQLFQLFYHAQGVITGVSYAMHLAAAVPRSPIFKGLRPCVVIAGGREPVQWFQYPGHQVLHTIGALDCCSNGGCWKSRVEPLNDGEKHDKNLCVLPVAGAATCMRMITPEHVVRAILFYVNGPKIAPKSLEELGFVFVTG